MSNIREMNSYIIDQVKNGNMEEDMAYNLLVALNKKDNNSGEAIAIIGASVRLPGANTIEEFWNNLVLGVNSIGDISENRFQNSLPYRMAADSIKSSNNKKKTTIKEVAKAGYMNDIECFDGAFFNISNQEAKCMEPMQRLVLEITNETLEDAGYGGKKIRGSKTGVYIGTDFTYRMNLGMYNTGEILSTVGSWSSIIGSRVSYTFDLHGPCIVMDTSCSSGLVAIHEACKAIRDSECNMALVGGINILSQLILKNSSGLSEVENQDGLLIAYDKNSKGTVWGEGVGMVLLKPLRKAIEDRDNIYSVIRGSAINNDGASNGLTSPNAQSQTDAILKAWKQAKINPEEIEYMEAHGTGTKVGDPIEIKGIADAFSMCTQKKQFCGLGTAKTNIGHTVGASGVIAIIKASLILKNKKMVPILNFKEPNPYINFSDSPLYVIDKCKDWDSKFKKRLAGVNLFGFSGTNCHIVLEEAPKMEELGESNIKELVFVLSAKSNDALEIYVDKYITYLEDTKENLEDIVYTASVGRGHYNIRIAVIASSKKILREKLLLIKKAGFKTILEEEVFCSNGKIISNKNDELIERIRLLVEKKYDTKEYRQCCMELCKEYVAGKQIDFENLYRNQLVKRVRVPIYPLERKRVKFAEYIIDNSKEEKDLLEKDEKSANGIYLSKGDVKKEDNKYKKVNLIGATSQVTEVQKIIAIIWGAMFDIDEVRIDDNFYDLGGNSLISIKLENELEKEFNIVIEENNTIEVYNTIEKLSAYVESKGGRGNGE